MREISTFYIISSSCSWYSKWDYTRKGVSIYIWKEWRSTSAWFCSDQDNCSNNRSIWESDPSKKRCPEEDWTVPVIAGLYMIVVNLLLVNIVIANFSNTFEFIHTNSEKLWHYHLYTVIKDYSERIPSPINLIWRPIQLIIFSINYCCCNKKVADSSHQTVKNEQEFQQTFQKIAALRNHKESWE